MYQMSCDRINVIMRYEMCYFVDPEGSLLEVPVGVGLVVHEGVPAVRVHVHTLLHREVVGRKTGNLWSWKEKHNHHPAHRTRLVLLSLRRCPEFHDRVFRL